MNNKLIYEGKEYDLSEWLTVPEYIKKYKLRSNSVVYNWINKGLIKMDEVVEFPELNYLKLVRNKVYKSSE